MLRNGIPSRKFWQPYNGLAGTLLPLLSFAPTKALDAVRSAILLSTLVPEIRVEANALASQLAEMIRLQRDIEKEKSALQTSLASLQVENERLSLLIDKKKEQEASAQQASQEEQKKTSDLAARARTLEQLINGMEQEIEAARIAVREAQEAEKRALEQEIETKKQKIAALKDAARLSPAIPFVKMKGLMHLPASGAMVKAYGNDDGFGGQTKGMSVATRIGAQVTSPADGWIVYAGPFRSFGNLLIINAGGGYHIVLSGMDKVYPEVGSFVLANEPVGKMQQTKLASSDLLDAGASRPVLYIELRKDGVCDRSFTMVDSRFEGKGRRMIRKLSLLLIGALMGAGMVVTLSIASWETAGIANAASSDTYRQLNLFGDVFETGTARICRNTR